GPHRAGVADQGAVQALRALPGEDRLSRVRGPTAPAHGRIRLGGGRRRDRELARRRAQQPVHCAAASPMTTSTPAPATGRLASPSQTSPRNGSRRLAAMALVFALAFLWLPVA